MVSKRYNILGVANYDASKPTNHIMHYDANELYGHAMNQPMTYFSFKWVYKYKHTHCLKALAKYFKSA